MLRRRYVVYGIIALASTYESTSVLDMFNRVFVFQNDLFGYAFTKAK